MNRRDFLKTTGGLAVLASTVGKGNTQTLDDAVITSTNDPQQYTSREVRDHTVDPSYVGIPLGATVHDAIGSTTGWELLGASENIEHLQPGGSGNIYGTFSPATEQDAYKEYWLKYRALDSGSQSSGITRIVDDEIDRYKTVFSIDYIENNGNVQTVEIIAPNSVTKYLMGWNSEDPIQYVPFQSINPVLQQQEFVDYFARLQEMVTNPDYNLKVSRIVNRNTPSPVPDPNPAYAKIALLDAISQGDVLNHDELYPTLIVLDMTDFT